MPVRLLDLSGTVLAHRSVVGSMQLYGLRQAAQRAGGSLQALVLAQCSLTPSAPTVTGQSRQLLVPTQHDVLLNPASPWPNAADSIAAAHITFAMLSKHDCNRPGVLSELCWADASGRMCCRLMRDLQYLDLSHNSALSRGARVDGGNASGECRQHTGLSQQSTPVTGVIDC